jgi:hypothetical protein
VIKRSVVHSFSSMGNSTADVVTAEVIFVAFSNISMAYTAYNFVNLLEY